MAVKIQFRRDTAANWAAVPTTVLSSGEVGYESDTGNIKIGDGTTQWQNLAYYQLPNVSVDPATTVDLNNVAYRTMGRYRLNSVTGTPFTNAPSDIDSDANSYSTLVVTTHFYSGASPATLTQQTLTQYSDSAVVLKQWVRIYNGTDWTAWSSTAHISANEVTDANLRQSAGLSVIGRSANTTGDVADITAANDAEVLRRSGTSVGFGTVATAGIADDAVTNGKIRNSGALSVIGRSANSSGDPADISVTAATGHVLRESGSALGFGTLLSTSFADNTIAPARLTNASGATVLGATAAGAISQLSAANGRTALGLGTMATETATDYLNRSTNQVGAINIIYGTVSSSTGSNEIVGSNAVTNAAAWNPVATLASISAQSLAGAFEISSSNLRPTAATGGTWFVIGACNAADAATTATDFWAIAIRTA